MSHLTGAEVIEVLELNPSFGEIAQQFDTGLSNSRVYALSSAPASVLKIQSSRIEFDFYTQFAATYLEGVSWLPEVFGSGDAGNWNWLRLEFVADPWPRDQWDLDPRAIRVLADLHHVNPPVEAFPWSHCAWSLSDIEEFVTSQLPKESAAILRGAQVAFEEIRGSRPVLCSGDPYPLNWRVRRNGELVRIDWQCLYLENPAFDLAGWISTTISYEKICAIAKEYCKQHTSIRCSADELSREIVVFLCRRWSTNFRNASTSQDPRLWEGAISRLKRDLPTWLEEIRGVIAGAPGKLRS